MKELSIPATREKLADALAFFSKELEAAGCPMKVAMQVELAVEEIFVNIASYAYKGKTGNAVIRLSVSEDGKMLEGVFIDGGIPFNPLKTADPDTGLSAEKRKIGGLGIFLVKKNMDDVSYRFENGKNILTIRKKIR